MTVKLSTAEQAIVDYVENDLAQSIDNVENEKNRYAEIARTQMNKKKAISIRLLESDIERIKAKSLSQGMPYQTLISALIHQYANGKIKLEA
jgi:predicted DNA binding CopG/RHH family protein